VSGADVAFGMSFVEVGAVRTGAVVFAVDNVDLVVSSFAGGVTARLDSPSLHVK